MKHPRISSAVAIAMVLGCSFFPLRADEAQSSAPAAAPETPAAKPARPTIAVGMTADEIRQIAGNPVRIKRLKKEGVEAEIWYYKYNRLANVKEVATKTVDVPWVDPITGATKMMPEPVYSQQRTFVVETTELLLVNGQLASSKRYRDVEKTID